jgi:hypothetical protein
MSKPQLLADILKDYFQNSNEPLAVEFRKHFAGTDHPLLTEKPSNETTLKDWLDSQDVILKILTDNDITNNMRDDESNK